MFSKIRRSLLWQIGALFTVSTVVILSLWATFFIHQEHENRKRDVGRYLRASGLLQPLLFQMRSISNEQLEALALRQVEQFDPKSAKLLFRRGDDHRGVAVYKSGGENIVHIYNPIAEIYLEDVRQERREWGVHTVFTILLTAQLLLFLRLRSILYPLVRLRRKLQGLQEGDLSSLQIDPKYEEIEQVVSSYNSSIAKIEYILQMREMFNKIFMHEVKMPLAKGMFYLKQPPSKATHERIEGILKGINSEIEEFSTLESLIVYKEQLSIQKHELQPLIDEALQRAGYEKNTTRLVQKECGGVLLQGDRELWILCLKNLLDNGLKYAQDGVLHLRCEGNTLCFSNRGDPLPVELGSQQWKISKDRRHKSSTGYGFGLFIIKRITQLHGYGLRYRYDRKRRQVTLCLGKGEG